jgi:DNA adenine methylase
MDFSEAFERPSRVNTKGADALEEAQAKAPHSVATPFVKWVGGKRNLMDMLIARVPDEFNNYYEPFVGGGALFFGLAARERIKHAYLSDSNLELVFAYAAIKKDPATLIARLKEHAEKHSDNYYYKIRANTSLLNPVEIAARFIYLNKTGYNGLYRVNKKGEFNVPVGNYKSPGIVQEDNIWACHKALERATIACQEFDATEPRSGDFIYFDPPYHPTDETSFTQYSKLGFTEQDQVKLRNFTLKLHKDGIKVMLSNSDTRFINDLYGSSIFKVDIVQALRLVNCKPNKRNAINEVLITNY